MAFACVCHILSSYMYEYVIYDVPRAPIPSYSARAKDCLPRDPIFVTPHQINNETGGQQQSRTCLMPDLPDFVTLKSHTIHPRG